MYGSFLYFILVIILIIFIINNSNNSNNNINVTILCADVETRRKQDKL